MDVGFRNGQGYYDREQRRTDWITAYDKDTLEKVGTVLFRVHGNKCYVQDVFVFPNFRRQGFATRLVQAMISNTKLPYQQLRWGIKSDDGVALKRALDRRFGKGDQ